MNILRTRGVTNSSGMLKVKASGISASSAARVFQTLGSPVQRILVGSGREGRNGMKGLSDVWEKPLTSLPDVLRFCFCHSGSAPYLPCGFERSRQEK